MAVTWARDGPDLPVTLDRGAGPLRTQIQDQLRAAIRDRRLGAGERLPSTRRLADLLGVSRGTVVDVYEQLLAEGYVDAAVGSGTRVAAMPAGGSVRQAAGVVATSSSRPAVSSPPTVADFEYGIPDLGSVPLTAWSWAVSEATATAYRRGAACSGRWGPWGWPRKRSGGRGRRHRRVRPRRSMCRSCGVTHVLLPATMLARRGDWAAPIGRALEFRAGGAGQRGGGAGRGAPAPYRDW